MDLVIVTGASRGIGKAIAKDVAGFAKNVLCISRSDKCKETVKEIRDCGGNAEALILDLEQPVEAGRLMAEWLASKSFARIGLILAAGNVGPSGALWETPIEAWDAAWRSNVLGNVAIAQACLPVMLTAKFGRLLFFAGGGAAYAYPLFPAYAAAKSALVRIVENLHENLKDKGDFATAIVAPGAVATDTLAEVRSKGGYVRTVVGIEEPVAFANAFVSAEQCAFSGRFVHVRDTWKPLLEKGGEISNENLWKLRRVE